MKPLNITIHYSNVYLALVLSILTFISLHIISKKYASKSDSESEKNSLMILN